MAVGYNVAMVFIKLRANSTPTKDFLSGLKKATGMERHKVRRAFVGTKIARNPNLSLSKQEVSKAIARFQKKSDKNLSKGEQKDLEDFLNKRYKASKKEMVKKNIDRQREQEGRGRGKAESDTEPQRQVGLAGYSASQTLSGRHAINRVPTGRPTQADAQKPTPKNPSQPPKKKALQEPEDMPID